MQSKFNSLLLIIILSYILTSCGIYGFKGISIPAEINTYLVEDFNFTDVQCETGIEQDFSEALRQKIRDESRLTKTENEPDITFEGTVSACKTNYIAPTEGSTASLNRLEISIKVTYINNKEEDEGWSKPYSAFQDYDSNADFQSLKDDLTDQIIDDITERVFNDAFTNW